MSVGVVNSESTPVNETEYRKTEGYVERRKKKMVIDRWVDTIDTCG